MIGQHPSNSQSMRSAAISSYPCPHLWIPVQKNSLLLCLIVLLAGCAGTSPRYSKTAYAEASRYCFDQAEADKRDMKRLWFTQWLTCTQERVMPIEIYAYPTKEADIKKMYERLFILAREVDSGRMSVQPVYAEWDRMRSDIKMASCLVKTVGKDGSEHCIAGGPAK